MRGILKSPTIAMAVIFLLLVLSALSSLVEQILKNKSLFSLPTFKHHDQISFYMIILAKPVSHFQIYLFYGTD